ncbi:MAG: DMT family transporter [Pelagimonas sp.]|uniref:DMT family transporter n=1 Tax=Pelagimonas sp. TaxID=2073170 RepID=UPI003D6BD6B6
MFAITFSEFHKGIALRLLAALLMVMMSAAVHGASKTVPVGQIMFWRSAVAIIPIVIYLIWLGQFPQGLRTRHPGLHLTRSLFGAFSMVLSFVSLAYLPVANAQALAYLAPVLTLPLAALLLGERLTLAVIAAVACGFAGVIALLWEALELAGQGTLIGIAAGLGYAGTMAFVRVHTKRMTQSESSSAIAFYFAIVAALVGVMTWPFGWAPLGTEALGWLVAAGLTGGIGHIVANEAVARAPVSALAPFDFTGMVWALGLDLLIFAQWPGTLGLLGVALITCAALLVTFRGGRS